MPYIPMEQRMELMPIVEAIEANTPKNAGEIQYLIARLIDEYLYSKDGARYQDMNDVMGALSGAQLEFYRCVVAPYEDKKMLENCGVYGEYTKQRGQSY